MALRHLRHELRGDGRWSARRRARLRSKLGRCRGGAAERTVPAPRQHAQSRPTRTCATASEAQRDAAKKAIQALQKQINVPSAQALADLHTTAPAMQALLALTLDFGAAYAAEKRRRSLVDFSDLEHMTAQLLTDDDGAPTELARQLSGRYTEIMVDEYQDVSEVQDLIFRAVSRDGNNLFFVGDVKQSIYRFRLADPTIFLDKYARFADFRAALTGAPRASSCGRISAPAARCWKAPTTSFPTSCPARSASWTMTTRPACAPEHPTRTTAKSRSSPCSNCRTRTTTRPRRKGRAGGGLRRAAHPRADRRRRIRVGKRRRAPAHYGDVVILLRSANSVGPMYRAALGRRASPYRRRRAAGSTRPRRCRCSARCWRWWTIRTRTCR
ncbi:MAG: UvrD-helicase domain-containing protein [Oscillospiraceae bacterium]